MKHAIIILAHKNCDHLCKLIRYFDSDFEIYIHIDKKSMITSDEISLLESFSNVKLVLKKFCVHWGGFSMLKCELFLLSLVRKISTATYFHLLSGQDYPIKPLMNFKTFFLHNNGLNFISYHKWPNSFRDDGTYKRFQYYYPFDWVDGRTFKGFSFVVKLYRIQRKLKIRRRIPDYFEYLYGGSQWFSITCETVDVLLNFTSKRTSFIRKFYYTFAPEETYIPTVIMNLIDLNKVVNSNLRWIRWKAENGNYPANISKEHVKMFFWENVFFARKMEYPISLETIDIIEKYMLPSNPIQISETGIWNVNSLSCYQFDITLADAIIKMYKLLNISSVVDCGCGCGHYVSYWRLNGMPVVGLDGNSYSQNLSSLLLTDNLCEVVDLTEELIMEDGESPFDLVICIDVIAYIPPSHISYVIENFKNICNKYLLISWPDYKYNEMCVNLCDSIEIKRKFHECGFKINVGMTNFVVQTAQLEERYKNIYVFEKCL